MKKLKYLVIASLAAMPLAAKADTAADITAAGTTITGYVTSFSTTGGAIVLLATGVFIGFKIVKRLKSVF